MHHTHPLLGRTHRAGDHAVGAAPTPTLHQHAIDSLAGCNPVWGLVVTFHLARRLNPAAMSPAAVGNR